MVNYTTSNISTTATEKINYIKKVIVTGGSGRIPASGIARKIIVSGDEDAVFSIEVYRSSNGAYYNFATGLFSTTITPLSRLKNARIGTHNITFPAADGDTYTVLIWPESHFNTELSFGKNKHRHKINLSQEPNNVTVTFATNTMDGTKAAITELGTSSNASNSSFSENPQMVNIQSQQITFTSHADDYGVMVTKPISSRTGKINIGAWDDKMLYWETGNYTANGSGSSATTLILTSVDDLYVGMQVSHVDGTYQSVLRAITAIDTSTLTVTLDGVEDWDTGEPIRFRAYGTSLIKSAISIEVNVDEGIVELTQATTTLRTNIEDDPQETANVNGTKGFGVVENENEVHSTVQSILVDNAESDTASRISAVTGSVDAGVIELTNSQWLPGTVGTIIKSLGTSNLVYITGEISLLKYPVATQTISLDITKFLTPGTNGS